MKISGFFTQVRQRFQTQDSFTKWSDTQHLLSQIGDPEEGSCSLASSASDISSSMRECADSGVRLYEGANIQTLPDLQMFQEQLTELFAHTVSELSDSNASQYFGLNELMDSIRANPNPSVEKLTATAIQIPNLLCVSSRFYQQAGRSRSFQINALDILSKLTKTTKDILRSGISSSSIVENFQLAHAMCSASKAWLQYQLGDSTCLATLNNAKNILESSASLNGPHELLTSKCEAMTTIKTWLAIFQLDEKFCPIDSPVRPVRVEESLRLLQECLPSLEILKNSYTPERILSEDRTSFEIVIADTMLKINHLLHEKKTHQGFFNQTQIIDTLVPVYDFDTALPKKSISQYDILGLAYILTRLKATFQKNSFSWSSKGISDEKSMSRLQRAITNIFEKNEAIGPDVGIQENKKALTNYAKELFSSMNQGHSHWMNLVACSRDPVFQFNEVMPTIDRSQAQAMF